MTGVEYIEAEDVRCSPFRVAVTPLPSLSSALREAAGSQPSGMPRAWAEAIRGHLRSQDYETLRPLVAPGPTLLPDPLLGLAAPPGESLQEAIERMMATPHDDLAAEIADCAAVTGDEAWLAARHDPGRWLRRYVASLLRAWKGFGPVWRRARPALDREVERIGTAAALDAQLELLDGLLTTAAVRNGRWCVGCDFYDGRVRFPDSGLVLIPLLTGPHRSILARDGDVMGTIAYPLRSLNGVAQGDPPPAGFESLLGAPRAEILRALERPTPIGRLAERLRAVPSAATYHVSALESAGLVTRFRSGQNVLVRRTERAEVLLAIYDELDTPARGRPSQAVRGSLKSLS